MTTNGESKFSYLFIGLGLGTIGGLMFALLTQRSAREGYRRWPTSGQR